MQQPNRPADGVLCLIEGYPQQFGGDGSVGSSVAHQQWARRVMSEQPGRWFLVGEMKRVGRDRVQVGPSRTDLRRYGYEVEAANSKVYARAPHPDGRPLSDFVTIHGPRTAGDALPELADNKFGWSKSEINDALATARAWLFPIEGIAA